ncbi:hypothetical protein Taro_018374 [Colocasia esculenta]|uniref:Uncharacterized protein n=1 Tax=Colocasia esculenta TaxID=4460 RepID=A0A843UTN7_COLES|nr:hypothetical protein [Colocasia esculenta]
MGLHEASAASSSLHDAPPLRHKLADDSTTPKPTERAGGSFPSPERRREEERKRMRSKEGRQPPDHVSRVQATQVLLETGFQNHFGHWNPGLSTGNLVLSTDKPYLSIAVDRCHAWAYNCMVCKSGVGWSPKSLDLVEVEQQLDLSSVAAKLRGPIMAQHGPPCSDRQAWPSGKVCPRVQPKGSEHMLDARTTSRFQRQSSDTPQPVRSRCRLPNKSCSKHVAAPSTQVVPPSTRHRTASPITERTPYSVPSDQRRAGKPFTS